MNRIPIAAALALWVGVLAGCTAAADSLVMPEPPPPLSEAEATAALQQQADEAWDFVASRYPEAVRPDVAKVRYVSGDEWAQVMVDCLQEQGIDAELSEDGGYGTQGTEAQALAHDLAQYVCNVQYPTDPSLAQPLTPDEIAFIYDYYIQVQVPCLVNEGYEVEPAPSREVFADTYGTAEMWSPYNSVSPGAGPAEWRRINEACPQGLPGFRE
jgi:hypothetical protein